MEGVFEGDFFSPGGLIFSPGGIFGERGFAERVFREEGEEEEEGEERKEERKGREKKKKRELGRKLCSEGGEGRERTESEESEGEKKKKRRELEEKGRGSCEKRRIQRELEEEGEEREQTIFPGRCITVTSASNNTKIFIEGVEISHPDLFNNGFILVHGLDGFGISPLSFSPPQPSDPPQVPPPFSVIRLMLSDAMFHLRISGFGILALAMRVKYAEFVQLQNMTVFALDDATIFSGGREYISNVRFHTVPNMLLMADDLNKLPVMTALPTLEHGRTLKVTDGGGGSNLGTEGREWNAAGPDVMESNGEMVDMAPTREIILKMAARAFFMKINTMPTSSIALACESFRAASVYSSGMEGSYSEAAQIMLRLQGHRDAAPVHELMNLREHGLAD